MVGSFAIPIGHDEFGRGTESIVELIGVEGGRRKDDRSTVDHARGRQVDEARAIPGDDDGCIGDARAGRGLIDRVENDLGQRLGIGALFAGRDVDGWWTEFGKSFETRCGVDQCGGTFGRVEIESLVLVTVDDHHRVRAE